MTFTTSQLPNLQAQEYPQEKLQQIKKTFTCGICVVYFDLFNDKKLKRVKKVRNLQQNLTIK